MSHRCNLQMKSKLTLTMTPLRAIRSTTDLPVRNITCLTVSLLCVKTNTDTLSYSCTQIPRSSPRTPLSSWSSTPALESDSEFNTRDPDSMTREELIAALTKTKTQMEKFVRLKREKKEAVLVDEGGDSEKEVVWTGTRPAKRRVLVVLD